MEWRCRLLPQQRTIYPDDEKVCFVPTTEVAKVAQNKKPPEGGFSIQPR